MLIVDSVVAPRLLAGNKRAQEQAKIQAWCDEQERYAKALAETSAANPEKQLGRSLSTEKFEALLTKVSPKFRFEHLPLNMTKKALFYLRGADKYYICSYENGLLPEHSVLRRAEEMVRDFSVGGTDSKPIQRADLPKHEFVPGEGFVWDPAQVQPGFQKIEIPWGELYRGWRTVLLKIVQTRIATPTQVEAVFGADDSAAWSTHTGKQKHELPW